MKRVKMNYSDLFYKFANVHALIDEYRVKNSNGVKGTLYKVDNMTAGMKIYITKFWKNTELVVTKAQYAPEIKHSAFIIYDKCIR